MKCLVTGATGFIGRELCRLLLERGHELLPYSCSGQPLANGTPTRAVDFRVDNLSIEALSGVDIVFHLAGIAHQRAQVEDYEQVNHRSAVELAMRASDAGVGCFLFLSSVKAMGEPAHQRERGEPDCVQPTGAYGLSKRRAEVDLQRELDGGHMQVCILRPSLVYGPEAKGNLELLSRAVARGLPRPPEEGGRSMIALSDLCELMLVVSLARGQGVSTYIAADGEHYSTRRIYDAMRNSRGMEPGRAWCPRWGWRFACYLLDLLRPAGEPTWQKLFATELYSNAQVLGATPWRPQSSFEDSLQSRGGRQ